MPRLVWTEGGASHTHDLTGPISFGRGGENEVRLNDLNISREHGHIEPDGRGGWQLVDRSSANGILAGGRRVDRLALTHGAEFEAGAARFRFEWPESAEATTLLGQDAPTRIAPPGVQPVSGGLPAAILAPTDGVQTRRRGGLLAACAITAVLLVGFIAFRLGRGGSPAVVSPASDPAVTSAQAVPLVEPGTPSEPSMPGVPPSAATAPPDGIVAAPAPNPAASVDLTAAEAAAEREQLATEIARKLAAEQARQEQAERQRADAERARQHRERLARLERELGSERYGTRWQAYEELRSLGRTVDPVPLWLLDLELHPDEDVREAAAEKLGRAQDRRAIRQLRWSAQYDDDFSVRGASEDALEAMGIEVD